MHKRLSMWKGSSEGNEREMQVAELQRYNARRLIQKKSSKHKRYTVKRNANI